MNPLLAPGPTRVVGVLNVTPDSFSDGGRHTADPVARGVALHAAGADLVDVGGESTRPGATRVGAAEELRRVLPVVEGLVAAGVPVSVDTMRAATARAVVAAARPSSTTSPAAWPTRAPRPRSPSWTACTC